MTYAKRIDANQPLIVEAFRKHGCTGACRNCGRDLGETVHERRRVYCSRSCMAKGYATRMLGGGNPNYGIETRTCDFCGEVFSRYGRVGRFCSHDCYARCMSEQWGESHEVICYWSPPRKKAVQVSKGIRESRRASICCEKCGAVFSAYKSSDRKFCSYKCFLDSGGAKRAGEYAAMAKSKYGAKKDANHNEIFAEIAKRVPVFDMSNAGFGLPDGIAKIGDSLHLFDVKNPKTGYGRRGLNERQKRFVNEFGAPVYLIYSIEDAANFAEGKFEFLKAARPEGTP